MTYDEMMSLTEQQLESKVCMCARTHTHTHTHTHTQKHTPEALVLQLLGSVRVQGKDTMAQITQIPKTSIYIHGDACRHLIGRQ